MITFDSEAAVFSSTVFTSSIDNWTVVPVVYITSSTGFEPMTFTDVVSKVGWSVRGTNSLSGVTRAFSTSTDITVFLQTNYGGINCYIIDPHTGNILQQDNYTRSGTGFQLGSSSITTATSQEVFGWLVGAGYSQYQSLRDLATATITTQIYQDSVNAYTMATTTPAIKQPAFNTLGPVSTSTYSI